MVKAHAVRGQIIDGPPGAPFYNVSIGEQPGDWRVENNAAFKGTERALIYHQAGEEKRGIEAAPAELRPFLHDLSSGPTSGPTLDLAKLWEKDGPAFAELLKLAFSRWPTPDARSHPRPAVCPHAGSVPHRRAGGLGPLRGGSKATDFRRTWNPKWQAYVYSRAAKTEGLKTGGT